MANVGERRTKLPLNWPYAKAVETARAKALSRPDFDPAVFFVWGQMQAMALLAALKAVERAFGQEGQDVCERAIAEVGREVVNQMLDGVSVPPDLSDVEVISLFYTWINEVVYASVEEPVVDGADRCQFDILFCPHENTYNKFDCRIQRYFGEGMSEAAAERLGHDNFNLFFDRCIQQGHPTCRFHCERRKPGEPNPWVEYTKALQEKALLRAKQAEKV